MSVDQVVPAAAGRSPRPRSARRPRSRILAGLPVEAVPPRVPQADGRELGRRLHLRDVQPQHSPRRLSESGRSSPGAPPEAAIPSPTQTPVRPEDQVAAVVIRVGLVDAQELMRAPRDGLTVRSAVANDPGGPVRLRRVSRRRRPVTGVPRRKTPAPAGPARLPRRRESGRRGTHPPCRHRPRSTTRIRPGCSTTYSRAGSPGACVTSTGLERPRAATTSLGVAAPRRAMRQLRSRRRAALKRARPHACRRGYRSPSFRRPAAEG